jgi:hypothetical protein
MYDYADNYSRVSDRARRLILIVTKALLFSYTVLSILLLSYFAYLTSTNFFSTLQFWNSTTLTSAILFQAFLILFCIFGFIAASKDRKLLLCLFSFLVIIVLFAHIIPAITITHKYGTQIDRTLNAHWEGLNPMERSNVQNNVSSSLLI